MHPVPRIIDREFSFVLADEHAIVRHGMASFLRTHLRVNVLAECSDAEEALREILEHRPDFVLMDVGLPKLRLPQLLLTLRESGSSSRLFVFSVTRDRAIADELIQAGAAACLLKESPALELLDAIDSALRGERYVSPALRRDEAAPEGELPDPERLLSPREMEVYRRLCGGVRPRDIASQLEISAKTVDTYRANILRKLELDSLASLIRFAIRRSAMPPSRQG